MKPSAEQVAMLNKLGHSVPETRRQAANLITKLIDEGKRNRAKLPELPNELSEKAYHGISIRSDDRMKIVSAFIRKHQVGEGSVLRDKYGAMVVSKVMDGGALKVVRPGEHAIDITLVAQKPTGEWMLRDDVAFVIGPPMGTVFFHAVRTSYGYDASKRLQKYIHDNISPADVRNTQYGVYWAIAAVQALQSVFEERLARAAAP
jgi:hypothetical protein